MASCMQAMGLVIEGVVERNLQGADLNKELYQQALQVPLCLAAPIV